MTWSPVSAWGAKIGLCFPRSSLAAWEATWPSTAPLASRTYQRRSISRGRGENVFIPRLGLVCATQKGGPGTADGPVYLGVPTTVKDPGAYESRAGRGPADKDHVLLVGGFFRLCDGMSLNRARGVTPGRYSEGPSPRLSARHQEESKHAVHRTGADQRGSHGQSPTPGRNARGLGRHRGMGDRGTGEAPQQVMEPGQLQLAGQRLSA